MAEAEGIQQELQDYLQRKGINTLFVNIVEALLLSKPDNPIQHIIQYLYSNFPDQCGPLPASVIAPLATSVVNAALPSAGVPMSAKETIQSDESESEDEDENENEDKLGDMSNTPAPPILVKGRRSSVSAETHSEGSKKILKPTVHPKSAIERKRILDIVKQNILFKNLDEKQTNILLDAFFPKEYDEGDVIITQGNDGDNFYIIDCGICEIYVDSELVQTCTESMSFGELALMYNAPRAATVKAKDKVKAWALDRTTFRYVLMNTATQQRERHQSLMKRIPILETLSDIEVMKVADALYHKSFEDGEVIIREGEAGNEFYIIDEGTAICTKQLTPLESPQELAVLSRGNYFGEIALLTTRPRQATVTSRGKVRCLALERKTFCRVMGPLEDILKRNLDQYNLIMANNI